MYISGTKILNSIGSIMLLLGIAGMIMIPVWYGFGGQLPHPFWLFVGSIIWSIIGAMLLRID
jgi:hypothetical protein